MVKDIIDKNVVGVSKVDESLNIHYKGLPEYSSDTRLTAQREQIGTMFPELKAEERQEAAENYCQYLRAVSKIYEDLEDKSELNDVLLRVQYEKRNRKKTKKSVRRKTKN